MDEHKQMLHNASEHNLLFVLVIPQSLEAKNAERMQGNTADTDLLL